MTRQLLQQALEVIMNCGDSIGYELCDMSDSERKQRPERVEALQREAVQLELAANRLAAALAQPEQEPDGFNGDNTALCRNIDALLALDASRSLVPHGVGGHARTMLAAAASRLRTAHPAPDACPKNHGHPHDNSLTENGDCVWCAKPHEPAPDAELSYRGIAAQAASEIAGLMLSRDQLIHELADMTAQRDALLYALRGVLDDVDGGYGVCPPARFLADKAIVKATGGQP